MITKEQVRAAKKKLLPLAEEHSASIGIGGKSNEEPFVLVQSATALPEGTFPEKQDGVKVVVEVVGEVKAYSHHHP